MGSEAHKVGRDRLIKDESCLYELKKDQISVGSNIITMNARTQKFNGFVTTIVRSPFGWVSVVPIQARFKVACA